MAFNIHNRNLLSLEHHTPRELRYLLDLSREAPEVAKRVVTVSPDFAKTAAELGEREVQQQADDLARTVERVLNEQQALDGARI